MQKKSRKYGILLFVKYPEIGNVKNRLSERIDKKIVIKLYRCFVEDILKVLNDFDVLICYQPFGKLQYFKKWIGKKYQYIPQEGENLGERMKNCFVKGFDQGYEKLIVLGSDSPDLPGNIIKDAFQKLDEYDCVIGPCMDGGYYLLGFVKNKFSPEIFRGIAWSTREVFEKTIDLLKKNSLKFYELPQWRDVDTFDDLKDLYLRNKKSSFTTSKSYNVLKKYFH